MKNKESNPNSRILTIADVAKITGWSIDHIYQLTSKKILKYSKPGGKTIFIDSLWLTEFLLGNPIKTAAEIESEAATFVTLKNK